VLAEADAISLHCPLTPETTGLIGEPELQAMKPSAPADQHGARRHRR
jgi:glycerate dehydrogenase